VSLYCNNNNKTTRDISVLDRKSDEEDRDKERGRERERELRKVARTLMNPFPRIDVYGFIRALSLSRTFL